MSDSRKRGRIRVRYRSYSSTSRPPSRTARVRREIGPRAARFAVALAQDARRASAGDGSRDPGVPVSVVGWSHLVPVPARGGVARRRGRVPRVWVSPGRRRAPGRRASTSPGDNPVPGDALALAAPAMIIAAAGRGSRIAPRASPMAPPKPPLSTEFPGAGGVSSRAPRAPGGRVLALLAARAGPAGLARRRRWRRVPPARPGSLAAVVDGGGEAHALAHPVRRGVRASHAVLGGTAAAVGALAAEIRADAAEPGGDGDAVPAGAAHGARDAGDDPGKRAGGVLNEASARVCALGVIGGSPGVETPVRAPRRVPDAPGGATRF